mmetsp:Transcript_3411/g.11520  ORF Transcript_3411/g.11520 Transcript_3411/m.11520 type:complete len:207 (-) Transcript_3411:97-717(-)
MKTLGGVGGGDSVVVVDYEVFVEELPKLLPRLRRLRVPVRRQPNLRVRRSRVLALVHVPVALAVSHEDDALRELPRALPVGVRERVGRDAREPLEVFRVHAHGVVHVPRRVLVLVLVLVHAAVLFARRDRGTDGRARKNANDARRRAAATRRGARGGGGVGVGAERGAAEDDQGRDRERGDAGRGGAAGAGAHVGGVAEGYEALIK